ncbi:MAG: SsrA-binding protein SmpB [Alphaproteobacteria bacterium]|nr:SsrA-binding protein SmpB [Alphaproteobacteria bacterium]
MAGKNKNAKRKAALLSTGTVAQNRRARHDYAITETIECGVVLRGTEVKSLRSGTVSLSDAYAAPKDGELWLMNVHIGEYPNAHQKMQHKPKRERKLLVKKKELDRLSGLVRMDGVTLIPLSLYFNDRGILKLSLGLGKGKKNVDKRETVKERDWKKKQGRLMREYG